MSCGISLEKLAKISKDLKKVLDKFKWRDYYSTIILTQAVW
jgi:tripartite-type tricarboxylate transporter receptor subunit TctC